MFSPITWQSCSCTYPLHILFFQLIPLDSGTCAVWDTYCHYRLCTYLCLGGSSDSLLYRTRLVYIPKGNPLGPQCQFAYYVSMTGWRHCIQDSAISGGLIRLQLYTDGRRSNFMTLRDRLSIPLDMGTTWPIYILLSALLGSCLYIHGFPRLPHDHPDTGLVSLSIIDKKSVSSS